MAQTPSTMLELGTLAPDFVLPDPDGEIYHLNAQEIEKGLLVIFMCNHCPFVIHLRDVLVRKITEYQGLGIRVVAINSNDYLAYPEDSPERMKRDSTEFGYTFPYLIDEEQKVAKAYQAACTPDFFLFDEKKRLVYRGQFDSARPGNGESVSGDDLSAAITLLINGRQVPVEQQPSIGCNIKWKKGNEPTYFFP